MLQVIRERLTGWFAVFILGAIALTLVATFGNIDTGFTAGGVAATVNGDDIPLQDFSRLYQRQRQQWETTYRAQIPDLLAEDLADQVLQSMIQRRVVAQHVRESGYRAGDADVVEAIENTPAFQVGGQFSRPNYEALLRSEGISQQRYEFETRQDMEVTQFIEGLGSSAFFTPAEFRRYIELDGETRDIEFALLDADIFRADVEVTEEEVVDFYESNKQSFMTEEAVSLEYVEVDFESILEDIAVTEEEARAYFEANPQEFGGPDERQAAHILIAAGEGAAEQAESLKERLDAGESFAALAAEFSADTGSAANGGDLGWLGIGDAPAPEFEEVLFTLQPNEISDPVETQFGYHLIRLTGVREGQGQDFAGVREELIQRLREDSAADLYTERLDELDERALESLDGLQPVAEALGAELGVVDNFTRSGGLPLGASPDLVATVFSLEVLEDGENSPIIELEEGRAVVVHVTEYRAPEVRPFADVKDEITAQLTDEAAIALVAARGTEALERLNEGAERDSLDLPESVAWQSVEGLRRGGSELAVDLAAEVFRAPKPPANGTADYEGLLLASGDFAIYTVTAVEPGRPDSYTAEDRSVRKQQLAGRLGGSQATALVETLVQEASVNRGDTAELLGLDNNL